MVTYPNGSTIQTNKSKRVGVTYFKEITEHCEIWDSHGCGYQLYYLLGYDIVQFCRRFGEERTAFKFRVKRHVRQAESSTESAACLAYSSTMTMEAVGSSKRRQTSTKLNVITSQQCMGKLRANTKFLGRIAGLRPNIPQNWNQLGYFSQEEEEEEDGNAPYKKFNY
jgi:hypothetical protein